ncbi:Threonine/homoserine/homoserine lactone efflux protein [Rhizobium sp. NFR07]|uniref:LysE family translocator n=1 Tax=Rhizobium sp. NFR07 TaxID=1566262 RepID=UPI0008E61AC7|nr:LysE family translocator [Rhizobium sp. NFR07]SFB61544.1 Threonine/homoserine/homoserine lactone efflux protein [Rhizobium sp. NFR07]
MTLEFVLTSLVIAASPGTGAIYTVAAGLSGGPRASLVAALGCTFGIVPHMLAAISGLAALMYTSALAFHMLKYVGVAYLLYMAWTMFKNRGILNLNDESSGKSVREVIVSAILINLLNPKLSIFFFAFLPQFVRPDDVAPMRSMLVLSLVFMAMTFVTFAAYGAFAATVRQHVISSVSVQGWMRRGFAASFAGLAAQLAFTQR